MTKAALLKVRCSIIPLQYATHAGLTEIVESTDRGLYEIAANVIFTSKTAKEYTFGCAVDALPMTIELAFEDGRRLRGWLAITAFKIVGNIHGEDVYRVTFTGSMKTLP